MDVLSVANFNNNLLKINWLHICGNLLWVYISSKTYFMVSWIGTFVNNDLLS